jgi:type I restriction enzyme M protein
MINPQIDEKVLDSSCGTGGFLVTAMTHVIDQLEKQFSDALGIKRADWDSDTVRTFQIRFPKWHRPITSDLI